MSTNSTIKIPRRPLTVFCRRHHIHRLAFFGSVLRDDFGPDSNVDVLVEFERGRTPGMFALGGMQQDLCDLFGREVDLKTTGCFRQ